MIAVAAAVAWSAAGAAEPALVAAGAALAVAVTGSSGGGSGETLIAPLPGTGSLFAEAFR